MMAEKAARGGLGGVADRKRMVVAGASSLSRFGCGQMADRPNR